jgi:serine/threonine protein kinase
VALAIGTRLGPYEVLAFIGAGGMGEVYRARDSRLGRDVAVKVLAQHLSASPEIRARFEREARTVSLLNHPHICVLHDVGREGDIDYLVMELVEGETLASRLSRGPLPSAEVLRLGAQIADALDRAHRAGVIHRDLKPGNVMLTPQGQVKLMDFGLAKEDRAITDDTDTQSDTIIGTPLYMSPGQMTGEESGPTIDIYSFACIAYELVAGKPLFEARTTRGLLQDKLTRKVPAAGEIGPGISSELRELLVAGLANEPASRLASLAIPASWAGELDRSFLQRVFVL